MRFIKSGRCSFEILIFSSLLILIGAAISGTSANVSEKISDVQNSSDDLFFKSGKYMLDIVQNKSYVQI